MHVALLPHLEGYFGGCLWGRVAAFLMHGQAPTRVIQIEPSRGFIQHAPQPPKRQLTIRGVDADHPPAQRSRSLIGLCCGAVKR